MILTGKKLVYLRVAVFKSGVDCSLYVDNFQIYYRSFNMNKLQRWANDYGFKFSKPKTVCMHICQKRGLHLNPQLILDKSPIPVVEETIIIIIIFFFSFFFWGGIIFDSRLFFVPI